MSIKIKICVIADVQADSDCSGDWRCVGAIVALCAEGGWVLKADNKKAERVRHALLRTLLKNLLKKILS